MPILQLRAIAAGFGESGAFTVEVASAGKRLHVHDSPDQGGSGEPVDLSDQTRREKRLDRMKTDDLRTAQLLLYGSETDKRKIQRKQRFRVPSP